MFMFKFISINILIILTDNIDDTIFDPQYSIYSQKTTVFLNFIYSQAYKLVFNFFFILLGGCGACL